jgi:hypothetical protein
MGAQLCFVARNMAFCLTHFSNSLKLSLYIFPRPHGGQGVSVWKALMALRVQSTTGLFSSRFTWVLVCCCAFAVLPFPQLVALQSVVSAETEIPSQGDGERTEEEQVVSCTARRRLNGRRHSDLGKRHLPSHRFDQIVVYASRFQAIVGHQLANGICAPLLI